MRILMKNQNGILLRNNGIILRKSGTPIAEYSTDKQFENRLNDNLEELVQVKKRLNRQPLFYLVGNQGQGKPVCEEDD